MQVEALKVLKTGMHNNLPRAWILNVAQKFNLVKENDYYTLIQVLQVYKWKPSKNTPETETDSEEMEMWERME